MISSASVIKMSSPPRPSLASYPAALQPLTNPIAFNDTLALAARQSQAHYNPDPASGSAQAADHAQAKQPDAQTADQSRNADQPAHDHQAQNNGNAAARPTTHKDQNADHQSSDRSQKDASGHGKDQTKKKDTASADSQSASASSASTAASAQAPASTVAAPPQGAGNPQSPGQNSEVDQHAASSDSTTAKAAPTVDKSVQPGPGTVKNAPSSQSSALKNALQAANVKPAAGGPVVAASDIASKGKADSVGQLKTKSRSNPAVARPSADGSASVAAQPAQPNAAHQSAPSAAAPGSQLTGASTSTLASQSNLNVAAATSQSHTASPPPPAGHAPVHADPNADPNAALNAGRLSRGLNSVVNQRGGAVTLRLTPASLGTVRIHLQMQGTTVNAQFHAQTDEAQNLLSQQMGHLRQALQNQGLAVNRITVHHMHPSENGSATQHQGDQSSHGDGRSRGFTGQQGGRQPGSGSGNRDPGDQTTPRNHRFDQLVNEVA